MVPISLRTGGNRINCPYKGSARTAEMGNFKLLIQAAAADAHWTSKTFTSHVSHIPPAIIERFNYCTSNTSTRTACYLRLTSSFLEEGLTVCPCISCHVTWRTVTNSIHTFPARLRRSTNSMQTGHDRSILVSPSSSKSAGLQ